MINQLLPSIMIANVAFECDPDSGSCASGCCACGEGCVCKVGHQDMSCSAGRHRVLEKGWGYCVRLRFMCGQNCW